LTTGAGLIALALLMPVLERDLAFTAPVVVVLALPCLALGAAARFEHVALSHAAFPASFLPAVIYMPGLFSGRAWAGFGGLLSLFAIVVLFAAFFVSASAKSPSPLSLRSRPHGHAYASLGIVAAALLGGLVAIWSPLAAAPASALVTAFGALASIALVAVVVGTVRRLKVAGLAHEPECVRQTLNSERSSLLARRRRAIIGIGLAALTAIAGILWYLRRGLI